MNTKYVGAIVFALIGFIIALAQPFPELPSLGHIILGIMVIVLGLWIFKPGNLPYTAGAMLLIGGCLIFGLKFNVAAAGFINSSFWVLLPALYFGYALQKTGLGKRIAYIVLKSFKPGYWSIILAWFIIGILLSLLTPSLMVRIVILMPIAVSVIEACKLPERSRGAAVIALVAWGMAALPGTGWLTGSLWGPVFAGFYPKELSALATWGSWFQIMALPWVLTSIIFIVLVYLFLRPKESLDIPRDIFQQAYASLGKITRNEIITAIILVATLICFVTESMHHVPTAATAIVAFFLLILFQIITLPEIGTGVSWDTLLFVGAALGLPTIFGNAQIAKWMAGLLGPPVLGMGSNPLLFVLGFTVLLWLIRFVDVTWGLTTIALCIPLLVPLYQQFGIHPIVVTMAFTAAGNCFFLSYQQPFLMVGEAASQGKGWSPAQASIAGLAYAVAIIISILVSTPYWRAIGTI